MQISENVYKCEWCGDLSSRKVHPIHVINCLKNPKNMPKVKVIPKVEKKVDKRFKKK